MTPVERLRGGLIVSCQAPEGSPLRRPEIMAAMAVAAEQAGAVGIRAQGEDDIRAIKGVCSLPVIGIRKRRVPGFDIFITPNRSDAQEMVAAGADIIAVDMRAGSRPGHEPVKRIVEYLSGAGVPLMADVRTFEEAMAAKALGADILATTMSPAGSEPDGTLAPDIDLLERIVQSADGVPVIGEGAYSRPRHVTEALQRGAHAVVVGRAITDPLALAGDFVAGARLARA